MPAAFSPWAKRQIYPSMCGRLIHFLALEQAIAKALENQPELLSKQTKAIGEAILAYLTLPNRRDLARTGV